MRLSRKAKRSHFEVCSWWDSEDQAIYLASNESETFILTVSDLLPWFWQSVAMRR